MKSILGSNRRLKDLIHNEMVLRTGSLRQYAAQAREKIKARQRLFVFRPDYNYEWYIEDMSDSYVQFYEHHKNFHHTLEFGDSMDDTLEAVQMIQADGEEKQEGGEDSKADQKE